LTNARWGSSLVIAFIGAQTLLAGRLEAQVESSESATREEIVPYLVDAIAFASSKSALSRLDVFVQVGYEGLSFVKRDNRYYASYEMTIDIYDSTGTLASEKLWTEELRPETFDVSASSQASNLMERTFDVAPGRYTIVTILRDNETKVAKRLMRTIAVTDFAAPPFSLSDIMLVSKLTMSGERKTIVPSISPNLGNLFEPFHIFFEAYNQQKIDSVKFLVTVLNEKKEKVFESDSLQKLAPGKNQVFLRIDHTKLPLGIYTIFVRAYPVKGADQGKPSLAVTSRLFVVRWRGVPKNIKDLDLAIDQIQYIAKEGEVSYIKAAKTPEEKQKRFLEFWKTKDPNPSTPRNEKMEEYYARIEYANKHFAHYIEGWRTDMGMVYIIFGAPNNVDRHPFDIDAKPYEVWSYYELNHQFVFVDQTGFGDYRLTTPIWDVWQRPRN
jgi:GWxTD domain-containing protein